MDKRFFEKRCHFSIRKFAIGAASVMIGASIFGLQVAQAAETESSVSTDASIHQVEPIDKHSEDLASAIDYTEANAGKISSTETELADKAEVSKPTTVEKESEVLTPKVEVLEKTETRVGENVPTSPKESPEKAVALKDHADQVDLKDSSITNKDKEEKASATE